MLWKNFSGDKGKKGLYFFPKNFCNQKFVIIGFIRTRVLPKRLVFANKVGSAESRERASCKYFSLYRYVIAIRCILLQEKKRTLG